MCSIIGYCGRPIDREAFEEGFWRTLSRGPDDSRMMEVGEGLLGFHRLSIMGLHPEGMQPFTLNGNAVVCNGEIYGFEQFRTELSGEYTFKSDSDCEILLPLYEKYGCDMFAMLDAEFACILYDAKENQFIAARDPIGIRPLYWGCDANGTIIFASEPKNLVGLVWSMAQQQNSQPTYADQVALLEKSYELAAKYMPSNTAATSEGAAEEVESTTRSGKAKAQPVGHVTTPVVSALAQPVSDSAMIARLSQSAGGGFHTAVGEAPAETSRNTIKACVHGDQTITSGQSVRLRLLEAMRVGKYVLPRNTLITGEGSIKGERLDIEILQVEHNGTIIPVELTVHDNDGQAGIFIPGSMEASAAKEMAANLGQNLGTSISITNQSAGDQLLSEVGRGAIQGVSQYISKKMREEKVHLKSGYTLMLYQNNQ